MTAQRSERSGTRKSRRARSDRPHCDMTRATRSARHWPTNHRATRPNPLAVRAPCSRHSTIARRCRPCRTSRACSRGMSPPAKFAQTRLDNRQCPLHPPAATHYPRNCPIPPAAATASPTGNRETSHRAPPVSHRLPAASRRLRSTRGPSAGDNADPLRAVRHHALFFVNHSQNSVASSQLTRTTG